MKCQRCWAGPRAPTGAGTGRWWCDERDQAVLEKALALFAPPLERDADERGESWRNEPGRRRMKALVRACEAASAAAAGGRDHGGLPVRLMLIAPIETLRSAPAGEAPPPGRTEYGSILSPRTIREMAREAEIIPVYMTADGQALKLGRTRRLFSPRQRSVLAALYDTCGTPGCDRPFPFTELDHEVAWAAGGATDLDNATPRCRWCNNEKERQRTGMDHHARRVSEPPGRRAA
jgi:hypothetical protein